MRVAVASALFALLLHSNLIVAQENGEIPPPLSNESNVFSENTSDSNEYYEPESSGGYFAQFDVMFLNLSGNGGHYVPFLDQEFDEPFIAVSSMTNHDFAPVPKVKFGYLNADGSGWEAVYFGFGVSDWHRSAIHVGEDETQVSQSSTWIHNGELNLVFPRSENGFSCLAGFRTFHLQERLLINEDEFGLYSNHNVNNHLYGGQVGIRYFHEHDRWTLLGEIKAGIFGNDASGQYSSQFFSADDEGTFTAAGRTRTARVSYMEELSIYATYQLTDSIYLRGGYHLFGIQGIARASGQLNSFGPLTNVDATGHAVLHGPSAGIEIRF